MWLHPPASPAYYRPEPWAVTVGARSDEVIRMDSLSERERHVARLLLEAPEEELAGPGPAAGCLRGSAGPVGVMPS